MNTSRLRRASVAPLVGGAVLTLALLAGCSVPGTEGSGNQEETSFKVASTDPVSLIPGNTWDSKITTALFEAPMEIDEETGEPVSAAAASVESDDQQTWTITLEEGNTFHNGEPVTSDSFIRAWNEVALGKNAWLQNGNFSKIEGYADLNPSEGEPTTKEMSGLVKVSDTEFTVTLTEPYGLFPYQITMPTFSPMPEAAFEDLEAYGRAPIGNGPYQIVGTYETDEPVTITRYEDYTGDQGLTDTITFVPYQSQDTAYNDLLAGNVDIVYPVPPDRLGDVESKMEGRIATSKIPNLNYLGLPTWDEQFQDVRLRQALSMAIDRDTFADAILKGAGSPAEALAPDNVFGASLNACTTCSFNAAEAKKLLEEAGGWEGQLILYGDQYAGRDQELQALANQFRNVLGIEDVTFEINSYARHAEILDAQGFAGPYQSYMGAYYPHIADFIGNVATEHGWANGNNYRNEEVEKLISEANALPLEESIPLYKQAEELFWKDQPIIPLYYGSYTAAWSNNLESVPVGFAGLGDLRDVQVK